VMFGHHDICVKGFGDHDLICKIQSGAYCCVCFVTNVLRGTLPLNSNSRNLCMSP
jgi:hypothetical protein